MLLKTLPTFFYFAKNHYLYECTIHSNQHFMKQKIRIGNAGGFWGDDLDAMRRQLMGGDLDYLTIDYLAEITMSILRKQQIKNPKLGYVSDFVEQISANAQLIADKKVTIIANAGGINPVECARQIIRILKEKNIHLHIAVIEGDNIIDKISEIEKHTSFENMDTGEKFEHIRNKVQSANVYLGIQPIIKALEQGADIIIAGRVTDTSITLAPMIHEFGWQLNDWDRLASGIVAGHIIECGAQSSGGNFTDWQKVERWDNFGYPIVEVNADATFVVTKHSDTGGLICVNSVKEQVVYEMGNPKSYISPDVIADFSTIQLTDDGENRVKVHGVKGYPSTHFYKVSIAYADGYKASGSIIVSAPDALAKAQVFSDIFWQRIGNSFEKTNTEFVGFNASHKNMSENMEANEILLKFDVYDSNADKLSEFSKNIAPLILSGPQGVAVTGGRPRIQSVMTYWAALIPKHLITSKVSVFDQNGNVEKQFEISGITGYEADYKDISEKTLPTVISTEKWSDKCKTLKFKDICLARSGDKGDTANIGVIARSEKLYDFIRHYLTAEKVKEMFAEICMGDVKRYELDNLNALNFLLHQSLDGGGTKSLMIDAQGKTFASALLNQKVEVPENLL